MLIGAVKFLYILDLGWEDFWGNLWAATRCQKQNRNASNRNLVEGKSSEMMSRVCFCFSCFFWFTCAVENTGTQKYSKICRGIL